MEEAAKALFASPKSYRPSALEHLKVHLTLVLISLKLVMQGASSGKWKQLFTIFTEQIETRIALS
jgi:hypothetical protein